MRRLTEKIFSGLKNSLQELRLADNLFGDGLNPVFSSIEFHGLTELRVLDLSNNQIRALEEGILKGCDNLQVRDDRCLGFDTIIRRKITLTRLCIMLRDETKCCDEQP